MKKKLLPLALAAAAGFTGIQSAQAVHVNHNGTGQVLLYPYYTVNGTQTTYVNVVNTTDQTKAVKVRFLEARNSREVLDFNLYLSPQDHWTALVSLDANGDPSVMSPDTSCIAPRVSKGGGQLAVAANVDGGKLIVGAKQPFRNFRYDGDASKFTTLDRAKEGYIEIIEMGVVDDATLEAAIKHSPKGANPQLPGNCALVDTAAKADGDLNTESDAVIAPSGGLYGYASLLDVQEGTMATYDAVALDAVFGTGTTDQHEAPGSILPNLTEANGVSFALSVNGAGNPVVVTDDFAGAPGADPAEAGIDSISAVLMASAIENDYVLEPTISASTDWVVTFPTKGEYVNPTGNGAVREPFTTKWSSATATACEEIAIQYYDREEGEVTVVDVNDFSPVREDTPDVTSLCLEANVVTFYEEGKAVVSPLSASTGDTGVQQKLKLNSGYTNGWARISFTDAGITQATLDNREIEGPTNTYAGLPVIGFAVQRYLNDGAVSGAGFKRHYAGSTVHKRDVDIAPTTP
ncbi:MAG: hypothetical protein OIF35_11010 [Cellvibrionaceae bacterium]|nr:hypothetical protein [Cellvibrionaceae bacterium]MCV6627082.1 hypothetical protein [Cellvibrionaceae bacterium]